MGLRAANGRTNKALAPARGTDPNPVAAGDGAGPSGGRWMAKEHPRGGHHGGPCSQLRSQVIRPTTPTEPPEAAHGSGRSRARATGTPPRFGHRVGRSGGRKPPRVRTFQGSRDPRFEEKLQDGVGR